MDTSGFPLSLRRAMQHAQMADIEGPNSIAARFDPRAYGSIESRKWPGIFNPSAQADAAYQQRVQHQAAVDQNINDQIYTDRAMQNAGLRKTVAQQQAEDEQRQKNWAYQNQQRTQAAGTTDMLPQLPAFSNPGDGNGA